MPLTEDPFIHQVCEKKRRGDFLRRSFSFQSKILFNSYKNMKNTAVRIKGNQTLELTVGRN